MSLTLSDVILGVRSRHPAFTRELVPDASLARFLTGTQRELTSKALQKDRGFLSQQMSISFALSSLNAVGTVGAGTEGGLPVDAGVSATSVIQAPMGTATELDVGTDAAILTSGVVASATSTTLVKTSAGWTTNAYANKWVAIRSGTGQGQVRAISSNTSTTLTVSEAWTTNPDTTSTFEVVSAVAEATQTFGVVASEPWSVERRAYLVKTNASGVAYLELAEPLLARYDSGIPLPPNHHVIGGTVRFEHPDDKAELKMVGFNERFYAHSNYCAYQLGQDLYLVGSSADWSDVESIDLRYAPIPPALTATTSTFLLPESAYGVLVDAGAYHAAIRVTGAAGVPNIPVALFLAQKQESEQAFLKEVWMRRRPGAIKEWNGY